MPAPHAPPERAPSPDGPLSGLGRFAAKLAIGTAVAVALAFGALQLVKDRGGSPLPREASGERARPRPVTPPQERGLAVAPRRGPVMEVPGPRDGTALEVERRHAAGELSEAQRRFERCPGGDLRREAWLDRDGSVLKLVHDRADGVRVEEWFDASGRLREAVAAGSGWARRVLPQQGGDRVEESRGELAPDVPPPALVRSDPSRAFFSGAGCVTAPGR